MNDKIRHAFETGHLAGCLGTEQDDAWKTYVEKFGQQPPENVTDYTANLYDSEYVTLPGAMDLLRRIDQQANDHYPFIGSTLCAKVKEFLGEPPIEENVTKPKLAPDTTKDDREVVDHEMLNLLYAEIVRPPMGLTEGQRREHVLKTIGKALIFIARKM